MARLMGPGLAIRNSLQCQPQQFPCLSVEVALKLTLGISVTGGQLGLPGREEGKELRFISAPPQGTIRQRASLSNGLLLTKNRKLPGRF
jgi:hypothetical protein